MSNTIRAACIQHRCDADLSVNQQRLSALLNEASDAGAQLVLLQELHNGLYFCQSERTEVFDQAEPIPGPSTEWLGRIAAERGLTIVASLFERRAAGLYHNTAVVLDGDRGLVGRYRKMHIPDDPGFFEKFYFTPGDLGFQPIDTRLGRLGVLVCWDQWYPEAARLMAMRGAEILLYPTAIGWDDADTQAEQDRQLESWRLIQRSHAVANGIPVLSCNRHGLETDPGGNSSIRFWGNSFIAGAQGEIIAQATADQDAVLMAELDKNRSETVRRIWPFFRDRRIDAYDGLNKRWGDTED